MNMRRVVVVTFCLLVGTLLTAYGQDRRLSPEGSKLANALAELHKKPDDPAVQEQYLAIFPHDYKSFLGFFDFRRELSDGHDYIEVLPSLANTHEETVGTLLIQLSRDAHKEADAPTHLQSATAAYGDQHTKAFAAIMNQLSPTERAKVITFLADVENHMAYPEYQHIIDHLNSLGQLGLAQQFVMAREERMRRHYR